MMTLELLIPEVRCRQIAGELYDKHSTTWEASLAELLRAKDHPFDENQPHASCLMLFLNQKQPRMGGKRFLV